MHYKPDSSNYRELGPGVTMKALTFGEHTLLCEFRIRQGAVMPAHQHPQEQTGYLVRGSLRFFGDEGEFVVVPGHSWDFKGGVVHGAEALADTVLIEVFSPVRQDYLPAAVEEQPE
jgi:quercetin dioxygenase-like cupin family protein